MESEYFSSGILRNVICFFSDCSTTMEPLTVAEESEESAVDMGTALKEKIQEITDMMLTVPNEIREFVSVTVKRCGEYVTTGLNGYDETSRVISSYVPFAQDSSVLAVLLVLVIISLLAALVFQCLRTVKLKLAKKQEQHQRSKGCRQNVFLGSSKDSVPPPSDSTKKFRIAISPNAATVKNNTKTAATFFGEISSYSSFDSSYYTNNSKTSNAIAIPTNRRMGKYATSKIPGSLSASGEGSVRMVRGAVQMVICLLLGLLFVSIPWEFCRLYQTAVGKKATVVSAGFPVECGTETQSVWQMVKVWLSRQLAWSHDDACDRYYDAMFVDPLWEVTPIVVVTSVLTRCVLHPAELLSEGLGRSLRRFFSHIPLHWQPVCMLLVVAFTLVTLIMTCSYRLHLPLLFRIEPKSPIVIQGDVSKNGVTKSRYVRKARDVSSGESDATDDIQRTVLHYGSNRGEWNCRRRENGLRVGENEYAVVPQRSVFDVYAASSNYNTNSRMFRNPGMGAFSPSKHKKSALDKLSTKSGKLSSTGTKRTELTDSNDSLVTDRLTSTNNSKTKSITKSNVEGSKAKSRSTSRRVQTHAKKGARTRDDDVSWSSDDVSFSVTSDSDDSFHEGSSRRKRGKGRGRPPNRKK